MDAGGSALVSDNDFGLFMNGTPLYATLSLKPSTARMLVRMV